jgi:hypothetical protein
MAVHEFPALGFDPAPGRPADLDALRHDVARHGNSLATARQQVAEIHAPGWAGQAADAFTAEIAPLPGDLDRSVGAFGQVAAALGGYALALEDAQRHATLLEQRAAQARATQHAADLADILWHGPDGETDAARQAREQDLRRARMRADDASGELAAILREAHTLQERAFGAAAQAARRIRAAAEQAPYREPNLFQQGLDRLQRGWESTKEWVADHAEVLHTISGVLKGIAAEAAVVALAIQVVPVAGQVASTIPLAVAAITGGAALGIDVLLKLSTGEGSWAMLGLDVALTVIPGAALARAGKTLLAPAKGLIAVARGPFVAKVCGRSVPPSGASDEPWPAWPAPSANSSPRSGVASPPMNAALSDEAGTTQSNYGGRSRPVLARRSRSRSSTQRLTRSPSGSVAGPGSNLSMTQLDANTTRSATITLARLNRADSLSARNGAVKRREPSRQRSQQAGVPTSTSTDHRHATSSARLSATGYAMG